MENIKYVSLDDISNEDINSIKLAYQIDFNIYYNKNISNIDSNVNEDLKRRKEECLKKINELGKKDVINDDKFIVLYADNKLKGFIKYRGSIDSINIGSVYGENEEIIKKLLKEFSNYTNINLSNAICNLNLDNILNTMAKVIKVEDFESDPNLINKLTKNQLIEVLNSIRSQQNNQDYTANTSTSLNENEVSNGGNVVAFQKKITNGHSILNDDIELRKQGFVDALVLSLLAGFFGGIITTLIILFIKIKTGL